MSMLSKISVAPESTRKSFSICGGNSVLVLSHDCFVYNVRGSTQILLLQEVEKSTLLWSVTFLLTVETFSFFILAKF